MVDKDAPPSTASGADLISSLSDGLREQVLSFLPTHEAVRTAMLAFSWRNIWMRSLALNITGWETVDVHQIRVLPAALPRPYLQQPHHRQSRRRMGAP
jgi:hypothetical protein